MIQYRIKNKKTGLYLKRGGGYGKTARMYSGLGFLKNSLLQIHNESYFKNTEDLVVEKVETVTKEEWSFDKFYEEAAQQREEKEKQYEEKLRDWRKKELKKELEELNKLNFK